MAVCGKADGTLVERIDDAPKPLRHALAKLRIRNRSLARKKKPQQGGTHKNRIKARRRLARTHQKVANQRRHYLHNLTSRLVKTHAHLVIEDLNVAGMVRNHKLGRSIMDVSWGTWRRQLEYKAAWHSGRVTVAPWNFPSTKQCHKCHRLYDMPLGKDPFICVPCNLCMPRDDNAFANLAQYGTSDAKQVEDGKIIPGDWVGTGRTVRCGETMPVRNQARPAHMGCGA
jgi:putative transposase